MDANRIYCFNNYRPVDQSVLELFMTKRQKPAHAKALLTNACAKAAGPLLDGLAGEIRKKRPFDHPEQEAFLNLLRTGTLLAGDFAALFKSYGLSEAAYNTLRVLRAAGDHGRPCHEIGEHLVARVPDVTRLVDRLEAAGLVERERSPRDRRVVNVKLTLEGRRAVDALDQPVLALHQAQLGHLSRAELAELNRLLVKARQPDAG